MKRYLIVGFGVAGATAAERIRKLDSQGLITVLGADPDGFYYRPRLPEYLAGSVDLPRLFLRPPEWYKSQGLESRLGEKVLAGDTSTRTLTTSTGETVAYDCLLLAVGAEAFIPPIPGSELAGVFVLRTAADARRIAERARQSRAAVLVGGGLLGLEAGHGLARLGLKVRVVEFFDRLLPRQMDPAGARKLQTVLESQGFSFYLGARARRILGSAQVEGLELEDGQTLAGETILFSAGIRPNLDLARSLGLKVDKGVVVDDRLQTSGPQVWAAGDCVEHRGRIYGLWPAAREQGLAAGGNMAGSEAVYQGTMVASSLKVAGVDLTSAGDIDAEGRLEAAVYEDDKAYRKLVLDQGRLKGFIFFGLTQGVRECQKALEKNLDLSRFREDLAQRDFDFSRLA